MNLAASIIRQFGGSSAIAIIALSFGVLGVAGYVAGRRWGWLGSLIGLPVMLVTILFEANVKEPTTWDEFGNLIYVLAGGFSGSLIATTVGIWLHQQETKRVHG
jgi:hypothetical protein